MSPVDLNQTLLFQFNNGFEDRLTKVSGPLAEFVQSDPDGFCIAAAEALFADSQIEQDECQFERDPIET
jgi:hypothetical protein